MPQLDLVTFLPQYVWLLITFFGFYFFIVKYFLPKIVRVYVLRTLIIKQESEVKKVNTDAILHEADALYAKACAVSKTKSTRFLKNFLPWSQVAQRDVTNSYFTPYYSSYLHTIALSTLYKELAFSVLSTAKLDNKLTNKSLLINDIAEKL